MIIQHFPNPNKPKVYTYTPVVHTNNGKDTVQMANGHGLKYNTHWAKKMSMPIAQFVQRDKLVKAVAVRAATMYKGASVYPADWQDYQRLGRCRIVSVIRSYSDWPEDMEWNEKFLYLVEAYSEDNQFNIFRATPGWFSLVPPVEPDNTTDTKETV